MACFTEWTESGPSEQGERAACCHSDRRVFGFNSLCAKGSKWPRGRAAGWHQERCCCRGAAARRRAAPERDLLGRCWMPALCRAGWDSPRAAPAATTTSLSHSQRHTPAGIQTAVWPAGRAVHPGAASETL